MIYKNNIKNIKKTKGTLKCKCGSTRIEAVVSIEGEGAENWLSVRCKRCGAGLYYNGA